MICTKCKKLNVDEAAYCGYCGEKLPTFDEIIVDVKKKYEEVDKNVFATLKYMKTEYNIDHEVGNSIITKINKLEEMSKKREILNKYGNKSAFEIAQDVLIENEGNVDETINTLMKDLDIAREEAIQIADKAYFSITNPEEYKKEEKSNAEKLEEERARKQNEEKIENARLQEIKDKENAERKAQQEEAYRRSHPNQIKSVCIVGSSNRKAVGSTLGRSIVGDMLLGVPGMAIGMLSAKTTDETTFAITYNSGKVTTEKVKNNSARFKELIKYLDN